MKAVNRNAELNRAFLWSIQSALSNSPFDDQSLIRLIPYFWSSGYRKLVSCVQAAAICALKTEPNDSDPPVIYCDQVVFPEIFQVLLVPLTSDDKEFLQKTGVYKSTKSSINTSRMLRLVRRDDLITRLKELGLEKKWNRLRQLLAPVNQLDAGDKKSPFNKFDTICRYFRTYLTIIDWFNKCNSLWQNEAFLVNVNDLEIGGDTNENYFLKDVNLNKKALLYCAKTFADSFAEVSDKAAVFYGDNPLRGMHGNEMATTHLLNIGYALSQARNTSTDETKRTLVVDICEYQSDQTQQRIRLFRYKCKKQSKKDYYMAAPTEDSLNNFLRKGIKRTLFVGCNSPIQLYSMYKIFGKVQFSSIHLDHIVSKKDTYDTRSGTLKAFINKFIPIMRLSGYCRAGCYFTLPFNHEVVLQLSLSEDQLTQVANVRFKRSLSPWQEYPNDVKLGGNMTDSSFSSRNEIVNKLNETARDMQAKYDKSIKKTKTMKDTISRLKEMAFLWNHVDKKKCCDYSNVRIELLQPDQNLSRGMIFWPEPTIPINETENTGTRDLVLKTNIENEHELSSLVVNPGSTTLKIKYKDGNSRRIAALMVDNHSTITDQTFPAMVDRARRQNEDGEGGQNEDGAGLLKQVFKAGTIVHTGDEANNSYFEGEITHYRSPPGRYLVEYTDGDFDYYSENEVKNFVKSSQTYSNKTPSTADSEDSDDNPVQIYETGIKVRHYFKHSKDFFEGVFTEYSPDGLHLIQYMNGLETYFNKKQMNQCVLLFQGPQVYRIGTVVENKNGPVNEHNPEGEVEEYDNKQCVYVVRYTNGETGYYTEREIKQCVKSSQKYSPTETQTANNIAASRSRNESANVVTEDNNDKKRMKKRKREKKSKSSNAPRQLDFQQSA